MGEVRKFSTENNRIEYQKELKKLIDFLLDNPESGRFVRDLLNQLAAFEERVKEVRAKLNKKEKLLDDLLTLLLHDLVIKDVRVSEYFEISIEEARRAMEVLSNQVGKFFMLREDDKYGWDLIIKKEATILGIK